MPLDQAEKDALYQEFKTRLAAETPPLPWWQDADKLIKVIGAIGILVGVLFGGFQSYFAKTQSAENSAKIDATHAETANKLDAVKADTHEVKTEAVKIGAKLNK